MVSISGSKLLRFGRDGVYKIYSQRVSHVIRNEFVKTGDLEKENFLQDQSFSPNTFTPQQKHESPTQKNAFFTKHTRLNCKKITRMPKMPKKTQTLKKTPYFLFFNQNSVKKGLHLSKLLRFLQKYWSCSPTLLQVWTTVVIEQP